MRTDTQIKSKPDAPGDAVSCSSAEPKETMKVRKSLHPLQIAAGDKENLVGAGRMPSTIKDPKSSTNGKPISISPKQEKKKINKTQDRKPTVTVEDLTSEAGPSENYWEVLAETRRKALEKALKENEQIHNKLCELEKENEMYKNLLAEAQQVIDTLNEVIAEMNDEDSVASDEIIRRP